MAVISGTNGARAAMLVSGSRLVVGFGASEEAAAVELLAAAASAGATAPAMPGAVAREASSSRVDEEGSGARERRSEWLARALPPLSGRVPPQPQQTRCSPPKAR